MAERLKVRLSTFLACFIAIATAFVLVEGSGWQKKEQEWEWEEWQREKERDFGLLLSLGEVLPIQLYANSRPWGFRQPRSLKRKNEQLLNVFLRTSNPREAIKGSSSSHRQREPLHVPNHALLDPATHEQEDHIVSKIPLKGHDQRRINKTAIKSLLSSYRRHCWKNPSFTEWTLNQQLPSLHFYISFTSQPQWHSFMTIVPVVLLWWEFL